MPEKANWVDYGCFVVLAGVFLGVFVPLVIALWRWALS